MVCNLFCFLSCITHLWPPSNQYIIYLAIFCILFIWMNTLYMFTILCSVESDPDEQKVSFLWPYRGIFQYIDTIIYTPLYTALHKKTLHFQLFFRHCWTTHLKTKLKTEKWVNWIIYHSTNVFDIFITIIVELSVDLYKVDDKTLYKV